MTYIGSLNIQTITRNEEDYQEYLTNGKQIKFAIKEHDILKSKPSVFESRANLYAYGF